VAETMAPDGRLGRARATPGPNPPRGGAAHRQFAPPHTQRPVPGRATFEPRLGTFYANLHTRSAAPYRLVLQE